MARNLRKRKPTSSITENKKKGNGSKKIKNVIAEPPVKLQTFEIESKVKEAENESKVKEAENQSKVKEAENQSKVKKLDNQSKVKKLEKELEELKEENEKLKAQLIDPDLDSEDDVADDNNINLCRFNGNDKKVVCLVEKFHLYILDADKTAIETSKIKDAPLLRQLLPLIFHEKVLAKYSAKGARKARKKLPFHILASLKEFYFQRAGKQEWTKAEESMFTSNLNIVLNEIRNKVK